MKHFRTPASMAIQAGFSLLEVLITIVILAFGLLGLAGLQAKTQSYTTESFERAQGILLIQEMANRVSANRANAANYVTTAPLGTGDSQGTSCAGLTGARQDLCEWSLELKGTSEQQSGSGASMGAMLGARGCIEQLATNPTVIRISVAWQGMNEFQAPSLTCGQNLYGRDGFRRTIASIVAVANLAN